MKLSMQQSRLRSKITEPEHQPVQQGKLYITDLYHRENEDSKFDIVVMTT